MARPTRTEPGSTSVTQCGWIPVRVRNHSWLAALEVAGLLAVEDADGFADTVLRVPVDARRPR